MVVTLKLHILPKLGFLLVSEIIQTEIRNTLTPIWHTKAATVEKTLNRLNICFKHATTLGFTSDRKARRALLGK
ncbi:MULTISPECIES: phage integrase central domain-containing protein [Bartonella]|uniref:phage integrase central domain-containing protein n=1 Tax=Bartonella TaxID=773 RepID=UPI0038577476